MNGQLLGSAPVRCACARWFRSAMGDRYETTRKRYEDRKARLLNAKQRAMGVRARRPSERGWEAISNRRETTCLVLGYEPCRA